MANETVQFQCGRVIEFLGAGQVKVVRGIVREDSVAYNSAVDGLEAVVLAHASAGVETAFEAIANNVD